MISTILEVAGLACLTAAAFTLAVPAGLAAAGVSFLFAAFALDKDKTK